MAPCGLAFAAIDWQRPWLAPYRACGLRLMRHLADGASVAAALNDEIARMQQQGRWPRPTVAAGPVHFVPQETLPRGEAYETFIHRTAGVPTRDNLHDLFNGLVWLHEPDLKRQLNALQANQIERAGGAAPSVRGALRDALTLFDENAALWLAPPDLVQALRQRCWQDLFGVLRPAWAGARLKLFGHALMEKLVMPRKAITAHVLVMSDGQPLTLDAEALATKPFLPLPVLGVPGWWPANEDPAFYGDTEVFRPARKLPGAQA